MRLAAVVVLVGLFLGVGWAQDVPSMKPVHIGVAVQVGGNALDVYSSWKQWEANPWLREKDGPYAGRFHTSGLVKKSAISVGITGASYAIAWKWPKVRKVVGMFNITIGGVFAGVAVSNFIRNPNR